MGKEYISPVNFPAASHLTIHRIVRLVFVLDLEEIT
jgi:hypothetical protein